MEYTILRTDSTHADFKRLQQLLDEELTSLYGDRQRGYTPLNIVENIKTVLCYLEKVSVGCACIKDAAPEEMEVKRVFVLPEYRGKRLSKILMYELERWAGELGKRSLILETGKQQTAAIALYKNLGYEIIENYGPYVGNENSLCMRKKLREFWR